MPQQQSSLKTAWQPIEILPILFLRPHVVHMTFTCSWEERVRKKYNAFNPFFRAYNPARQRDWFYYRPTKIILAIQTPNWHIPALASGGAKSIRFSRCLFLVRSNLRLSSLMRKDTTHCTYIHYYSSFNSCLYVHVWKLRTITIAIAAAAVCVCVYLVVIIRKCRFTLDVLRLHREDQHSTCLVSKKFSARILRRGKPQLPLPR